MSASDASAAAVEVARANADAAGARARGWRSAAGCPQGEWDLVVANLPYVREDEWDSLEPEITRWEPREALVSGEDGLDAIRELVAQAAPGTRLALEHAPGQAEAVRALLEEATTSADLAGRERVTSGRR